MSPSTRGSMAKRYIIPYDPIAWARPVPRHSRVWDAQKNLKFSWGIVIAKQHENLPLFKGPLHLDIHFYFKIPKKKKDSKYYIAKPDLSNLIKLIEDICTGILYEDDRLIVYITSTKTYDAQPRTEFSIYEIGE